MKKNKKMFTMVGSLALVGAVAVGATLAYLSDNTSTITNTFTVGSDIEIQISEKKKDTTDERIEVTDIAATQPYGQLTVGKPEVKDPRVDMLNNSNNAYVYMYVEGVDSLKELDLDGQNSDSAPDFEVIHDGVAYEFDDKWTKIALINGEDVPEDDTTLDGIYVYDEIMSGNNSTESLFDHIMIADDVQKLKNNAAELLGSESIILKAAAYQSDNVEPEIANEEAVEILKKI